MRLMAIGGGNPASSSSIHVRAALDMTGAQQPKIVYIPTPKRTEQSCNLAVNNFTEYYGRKLGLDVKLLHAFNTPPDAARTCELLQWANMIYVAGGDTKYAIDVWAESEIANILRFYVSSGQVVACGISAGAVAWFKGGCSDSDKYNVADGQPWEYREITALGLVDGLACPHYNTSHPQTQERRSGAFAQMLFAKEDGYVSWGIENHAALQIIGRTAQVLSTRDNFVHKLTRTTRGLRNVLISPKCGTFTI